MSLKQALPSYHALVSCGDSEAECDLAVTQDGMDGYCVSLDGEEFPACLIPDLIEFLKIAQAWIDANNDNA